MQYLTNPHVTPLSTVIAGVGINVDEVGTPVSGMVVAEVV